jgi:arylsulfatase A-like enzyme
MKPNIFLMVIDSLQARKFYRGKTSLTPNIDSLIKKGTYFENLISACDTTLLSLTSLFTGKHAFKTGIGSPRYNKLNDDIITYFQILKESGYHLFAHRPSIGEVVGLMPTFENDDSDYFYDYDLSSGLGKRILDQLDSKLPEPWFFYAHNSDLHFPVDVVKEFDNEKFGMSKYDRMISSIDSWIGKFVEKIDLQKTLFIITADHATFVPSVDVDDKVVSFEVDAEKHKITRKINDKLPKNLKPLRTKVFFALENIRKQRKKQILKKLDLKPHEKRALLWQRGDLDHTLLDDQVHIPLLLFGSNIPKDKKIPQLIRQIDIFPTIMDLLGISAKNEPDGVSLVPLLQGKNMIELPAYMESTPLMEKKSNDVIGIRTSNYKYFRDSDDPKKRIHLYDLKNDPFEEKNIAESHQEIVFEIEKILQTIIKEKITKSDEEFSEEEAKMIEDKLRYLGYI